MNASGELVSLEYLCGSDENYHDELGPSQSWSVDCQSLVVRHSYSKCCCFQSFLFFGCSPTGRGSTVNPVDGNFRSTRYQERWYTLEVTRSQATNVGLWVFPSRLVSFARCCQRAFGLPPICPSIVSLRRPQSSVGSRRLLCTQHACCRGRLNRDLDSPYKPTT